MSYFKSAYHVSDSLINTLLKAENIHGFILKGESGIGKTYSVSKQLESSKLQKGIDFEILSSYTTSLALYQFLYEHRDKKVIILDDVASFFNNSVNIGLVLSALWGEDERRVHYNSSILERYNLPKSFVFNAKIIWCVNDLPKGIEAIKSRCFFYELNFDYDTKINLMFELATINNIPVEIVEFIKQNTDESVVNLDFRLLMKVWDLSKAMDEWQDIAIKLISKDEKKYLLMKFLNESSTITEAQKKWSEETNMSRASFFVYKNNI